MKIGAIVMCDFVGDVRCDVILIEFIECNVTNINQKICNHLFL